MTEDDARGWIAARYDDGVMSRLGAFVDLLIAGNAQQNLIAPSTMPTIWSRHIVDSAQLIAHAPAAWRHWVDVGSGAGLPGLVVSILCGRQVTLIEPRRLRVEFLNHCSKVLELSGFSILQCKAENADIADAVDVVSARAVAKLDRLFASSQHFASKTTTYILPKGEGAESEVAAARGSWQGMFHVEHSIVDPKSGIVIATGIARR